ncbi:MAG: nitrogen fixation protein NifZ [Pseudomonadota bacterium]
MGDIARDSDTNELSGPPRFGFGQKVRSRKTIRNDGTFTGREIGDILVKKGDVGYVTSIGTFLQQFYIYGVDFVAHGYRVGMKGRELEAVETVETVEAPATGEVAP